MTIRVAFRFYGRLNDFLPARHRQRRFTYVMSAPTSVKDAIEALGVPHPEVDVVVINGEGEEWSYRLQDGDAAAVYPAFRSIDVTGLRRAGADPPHPVRFVLDAHLGKLASFLRLAGFDALLRADDAELAETSAREGRVALTRDVGLLKRSDVRHGYWVRHTNPELQLAEVLERFDLAGQMAPFDRCLRCSFPQRRARSGTPCRRDREPPFSSFAGARAAAGSTGKARTTAAWPS
jgi:hypothetical protein